MGIFPENNTLFGWFVVEIQSNLEMCKIPFLCNIFSFSFHCEFIYIHKVSLHLETPVKLFKHVNYQMSVNALSSGCEEKTILFTVQFTTHIGNEPKTEPVAQLFWFNFFQRYLIAQLSAANFQWSRHLGLYLPQLRYTKK